VDFYVRSVLYVYFHLVRSSFRVCSTWVLIHMSAVALVATVLFSFLRGALLNPHNTESFYRSPSVG
jgi:hypothetical protein